MVGEQALRHIGHVEGFLGNQDLRGAAGDASVGRDPAGMAAHHLDDHNAVVGLAGRAQAVDGVGGGLHGGVEAKGELGDSEVVVDGLGDADDGGAFGGEPAGDGKRVVATDGDEGVDALAFKRGNHSARAAFGGVGVGARGAEDGAAEGKDVVAVRGAEGHEVAFHDARPAVAEADDFVAVLALAFGDNGSDDRVQSRAVASAGQDSHTHDNRSRRRVAITVPRLSRTRRVETARARLRVREEAALAVRRGRGP